MLAFSFIFLMAGCKNETKKQENQKPVQTEPVKDFAKYAKVKLTADISGLSENQKKMLKLLFLAADQMDDIYWQENFGDKNKLFSKIENPVVEQYAMINYGPWDELNNLVPFVPGPKPTRQPAKC